MKLNEILEAIENTRNRYGLSDDFLEAKGRGTGEFQYGVSSAPCNWVYPYLKALSEDEKLSVFVYEIEEQMRGDPDELLHDTGRCYEYE